MPQGTSLPVFVYVTLRRQAMTRHLVSECGHILHASGVDPAIVEIEKGADADGIIERFIGPARAAASSTSSWVIWFEVRLTLETNLNSAFSASEIGAVV